MLAHKFAWHSFLAARTPRCRSRALAEVGDIEQIEIIVPAIFMDMNGADEFAYDDAGNRTARLAGIGERVGGL